MYYDDKADAKLGGKVKDPIVKAVKWVKSRSQKEKGIMGCAGAAFVSCSDAPPYGRPKLQNEYDNSICPRQCKLNYVHLGSSIARAGRLELAHLA